MACRDFIHRVDHVVQHLPGGSPKLDLIGVDESKLDRVVLTEKPNAIASPRAGVDPGAHRELSQIVQQRLFDRHVLVGTHQVP
jgi:hypothetical protein